MESHGKPLPHEVVAELKRLFSEIDFAIDLEGLRPIFYRSSSLAGEYPEDPEIQSLSVDIKRRIAERGARLKQLEPEVPPLPAERPPIEEPPPTTTPFLDHTTQQKVPVPPIKPPVRRVAPPGRRPPAWMIAAAVAGVLVVALVFWRARSAREPLSSDRIRVDLQTNPPGASVHIDDVFRCTSNCQLELSPGSYKLEVALEGFEPLISAFNVGTGLPPLVSLTLQPRPQTVRFFTDLVSGTVTLDGNPAGELKEGQLVLDGVPMGAHAVKIAGGGSEASFSFELFPGKPPALTSSISARNVLAVVVSNAGRQATARSSRFPMPLKLRDQLVGNIGPDGLELSNIEPGDHQLTLGEGSGAQKVVARFGPAPALTAFLKLDLNVGALLVVTAEDDVSVFLNGKEYRRRTAGGELRIPRLGVRDYAVSVSKPGYEQPPGQSVSVRKGEESRIEFRLKPIAQLAALRIRGAAAGTSVFLDQAGLGAVQPDGSFSHAGVTPGDHTIELRREKHHPKRIRKTFPGGATVDLLPSDVALERLPGTLRLTVSPSGSQVTIRAANQTQASEVQERVLTLPEGSYVLRATAPEHSERSSTVQVAAGETVSVDLKLDRVAAVARVESLGMEGWENPKLWVKEGDWLARKGGDFIPFRATPVSGTFVFTAALLRGRQLQWALNYTDGKNYVFFQLDKNSFSRNLVAAGKTRELAKTRHPARDAEYFTVSIDVAPHAVTHRLFTGGNWTQIDLWQQPDRDFTQGKFGFLIPGSDHVGLSNFTFTPR